VGKTALAQAFGEAAACLNPAGDPFDACGTCDSCRRAAAGQQPEIAIVRPAGEQTQIWQFWDRDNKPAGLLQHTLTFAPSTGRRRVYIIERADTLTESAANSLLKVLEEPPPYALFILLTPHASRMLPTVLSRAQMIRLSPSPVADLTLHLEGQLGLPPERARTIAAYAEGRTGTALRMARDPAVETEIAAVVELAEGLGAAGMLGSLRQSENIRKVAGALKALSETDAEPADKGKSDASDDGEGASKERVGRKQVGIALDLLGAVFRDVLALAFCGEDAPVVHSQHRARLVALSRKGTPDRWMTALDTLLAARRRLDQNAGIPLLTDWVAVRIAAQ
jgi:DNA polymerase-3 subunit delta'